MEDLLKRLKSNLKNYSSVPFWSWNDELEEDELVRQIHLMKEANIGGFFMHARAGLKTSYLGEKWFNSVKTCVEEAERLDMNAWCYDENGWPSGFADSIILDNKVNHVKSLVYGWTDSFQDTAIGNFILENEIFIKITEPTENKKILFFKIEYNHSYADILNPDTVKNFIEVTHQKYHDSFSQYFGKILKGFFTDEPQFHKGAIPWTQDFERLFYDEYQYDILEYLPLLVIKGTGYEKFRYDFWTLINKRYTESFIKQIYEWSNNHNSQLTGHTVQEDTLFDQMQCSAGVMPFYEYQHIPGIDWLGRNISHDYIVRQCFSVASQLGKKQVLSEMFGCTGWNVNFKQLKKIAEWQYVNGVNLMCQHLVSYSIKGMRKRDYPPSFSYHTPWYREFKGFNEYFNRLSYLLTESTEVVNVLVIHPLRSCYIEYDKNNRSSTQELEDGLIQVTEFLSEHQISYHLGDESIIENHGSVDDKFFIIGKCQYTTVILPTMITISSHLINLLKHYISNGGKIIIEGKKPNYLNGVYCDFSYLCSNSSLEDVVKENMIELKVKESSKVRSTLRKSNFGDFLYVVNLNDDNQVCHFNLKDYDCISELDLVSLQYDKVDFTYHENLEFKTHLKAGQSRILFLNKKHSLVRNIEEIGKININNDFEITSEVLNTYTLDYASLKQDDEWGVSRPAFAIMEELINN